MLLTGHADSDAAMNAVNDGQIARFLTKPCDREELLEACAGALWQHRMHKTERDLLEQTLHGSVAALTEVLALAAPAVFEHSARLRELVVTLAVEGGWSDAWEIEVAALLAQVGAVTLSAETAERLHSGAPLTADERAMVARVPAATHRILANIAGLDGVLQILSHQHRRFDSSETDGMLPVGARMLRIAIDFIALERANPDPPTALKTMRARDGVYDTHLLEAFARTVGPGTTVSEIAAHGPREGMTLVSDGWRARAREPLRVSETP
jgi:response regulator RpfG family c-di-GMP phosphodiesterase